MTQSGSNGSERGYRHCQEQGETAAFSDFGATYALSTLDKSVKEIRDEYRSYCKEKASLPTDEIL